MVAWEVVQQLRVVCMLPAFASHPVRFRIKLELFARSQDPGMPHRSSAVAPEARPPQTAHSSICATSMLRQGQITCMLLRSQLGPPKPTTACAFVWLGCKASLDVLAHVESVADIPTTQRACVS